MWRENNLRRLRLQHQITLRELEAVSGVSNQYISCAELGTISATVGLSRKMDTIVELMIASRREKLLLLEADFLQYRGRLLEPAEDESHE